MSAHTPGPWAMNPIVATVDAMPSLVPVCQLLWPTDLRSEAETEANAKLIAAAPELLYAAKATVAAFEDSHDVLGRDNDWIYDELGSMQATAYFAARAAIAKAQMP